MSRPVIGITAYVEQARYGPWDAPATLIPHRYVERVTSAGGQPVVLPPVGDPLDAIGRLDGLIVAGGGDVDPARYGARPHPGANRIRPDRDDAELALTSAALETGLPLLGVCRGMQVLNVARGGNLHQHLPDLLGHVRHAPAPATYGRVPVRLEAGSLAAEAAGTLELNPSHYHHQAVDRIGDGLTAVGWADDGVVEAVELADHPFALGVEWHPEVDDDLSLFQALVARASGRR
ncbi:MAG: gamma-glutamyl-gamma-aminobutyrate hydrolase family protein [Stackebrandtia sp.]